MRASVAGQALLSPVAIASMALMVWNDLWLKRHHPGMWSGKLSDVALCVFLPLFTAAALQYGAAAWALVSQRAPRVSPVRLDVAACIVAAIYFTAVKVWPAATHAHVAWLTALVPSWRFRATTDPTDLFCLPAFGLAWWALRRSAAERPPRASPSARPVGISSRRSVRARTAR